MWLRAIASQVTSRNEIPRGIDRPSQIVQYGAIATHDRERIMGQESDEARE